MGGWGSAQSWQPFTGNGVRWAIVRVPGDTAQARTGVRDGCRPVSVSGTGAGTKQDQTASANATATPAPQRVA
ncbi:hypothetical protein EHYA_05606 [Embleya hyalina]|uniref:Uncharacterized protein n=1 Tax=Embleya hyalina TaxID=516124 RepID=A0A401YTF4_9ACTN|nr:hypothetical protein EHYA_05606 [Embleya hyalina]